MRPRSGWTRVGLLISILWIAGGFAVATWVQLHDTWSYPGKVLRFCLEHGAFTNEQWTRFI